MRRKKHNAIGLRGRLYSLQGLENISLHVFEVFNSEGEPNQVIHDPILKPIGLAKIPETDTIYVTMFTENGETSGLI